MRPCKCGILSIRWITLSPWGRETVTYNTCPKVLLSLAENVILSLSIIMCMLFCLFCFCYFYQLIFENNQVPGSFCIRIRTVFKFSGKITLWTIIRCTCKPPSQVSVTKCYRTRIRCKDILLNSKLTCIQWVSSTLYIEIQQRFH